MEPRIQYAKTEDGVSIAWAEMGAGPPALLMPSIPLSWLVNWRAVESLEWRRLAEGYRLIVYDARGTGLSDLSAMDFSMEAMLRDLEAVIAHVGDGPLVVSAQANAVPIAVNYAVSHPERVSRLVFVDGWTEFSDWAGSAVGEMETAVRKSNWDLFTDTYGRILWGIEDPEVARLFAEWMRASCTQEAYQACYAALESYDATDSLASIRMPTLVIHNRKNRWGPVSVGQRIAATIPDARLLLVDDLMYTNLTPAIREFIDGKPAGTSESQARTATPPTGLTVILFADIADSTALTERLGDAAFREKARDLDAALRAIIRENAGTPIEGKLLGDGVLATFASARQAIEAALACGRAGQEGRLPLHLGLHAGDVIREEGNVFGGAVNIAAPVSGMSAPGEVLVSDIVRGLARTSAGVGFEDRGERELKGVGEAVRVWAVREAE
jgi:class 3 adenylate cyclase/pimeloyl-ACP methyl ester carboxylesterase